MYSIPKEYFFRIHHIRPRFKDNVEEVLLYMAHSCSSLGNMDVEEYRTRLNSLIRLYPENAVKNIKTINNWRTEISALFGFYIEDKNTGITRTGNIAYLLDKEQDLVQFFKYYLIKFQYPGGHLKPEKNKEIIDAGIRFKPAQYILKVLFSAYSTKKKNFAITKEEATHCIFNDLRTTRDNRNPEDTVALIEKNRKSKFEYEHGGDINRYAGDILDYMVLANLLYESHGYYYLNHTEMSAIMSFINDTSFFKSYDKYYGKDCKVSELNDIEIDWFNYVNDGLDNKLFRTELSTYSKDNPSFDNEAKGKIDEILYKGATTKDIGDLGESLIIGHEKTRLVNLGREDLIHLVKKIPTSLAVGYDIQSIDEDMGKRYIEAKTTISCKPLKLLSFCLTDNEWNTAASLNDRYFVYRLIINKYERTIYIIQDPVRKFKQDKISMSMNKGANITFKESVAEKKELLLWKE